MKLREGKRKNLHSRQEEGSGRGLVLRSGFTQTAFGTRSPNQKGEKRLKICPCTRVLKGEEESVPGGGKR